MNSNSIVGSSNEVEPVFKREFEDNPKIILRILILYVEQRVHDSVQVLDDRKRLIFIDIFKHLSLI